MLQSVQRFLYYKIRLSAPQVFFLLYFFVPFNDTYINMECTAAAAAVLKKTNLISSLVLFPHTF